MKDSQIVSPAWNLSLKTCFPGGSVGKVSACNAEDLGLIPGSGRSPGEGNGNPLQYSCLEKSMDGGAWWATVHGAAKSWTRLSDFFLSFTYLHDICTWTPDDTSHLPCMSSCLFQVLPVVFLHWVTTTLSLTMESSLTLVSHPVDLPSEYMQNLTTTHHLYRYYPSLTGIVPVAS